MRRWLSLGVILLLAGCERPPPAAPLVFTAVPWADGEETTYDVFGPDGARLDSSLNHWSRDGAGWTLKREGVLKKSESELTLDATGAPAHVKLQRENGDVAEGWFEADKIRLSRVVRGKQTQSELERSPDAIEGREFYQPLRLLPFAAGYQRQLTFVDVSASAATAMDVKVEGEESITVPAGTFAAWHVLLDTRVAGKRELWYAKEPPRLWLKYKWSGHSQLLLRSYRLDATSVLTGTTEPSATLPGSGAPLPPFNFPAVLAQVLVQLPLSTLFPVALALWVIVRRKLSFRIWAAGLVCFPLSQLVHVPLNRAIGIGGLHAGGLLSGAPDWAYALLVGLSAGLCEEWARYAVIRFGLKRPGERGGSQAVLFGVGHGGIEAVILSGLPALGGLSMLIAHFGNFELGPAQREGLRTALEAYAGLHGWEPLYGALERLGAISCHVLLSLLVMRAVVRRNFAWMLAAIGLHAAIDAPTVYLSALGPHLLLAILLVVGLLSAFFSARLARS